MFNLYTYGTAQRQLDTCMWVVNWPTAGRPTESIQIRMGACQHPQLSQVRFIGHPQLRTCSTRLDTSRSFKINYCSPLYSYQHSVLYIHTSIMNPRANSTQFLKVLVSIWLGLSMCITKTFYKRPGRYKILKWAF